MKRAMAIAVMAMVLIPAGTSGEPDTFGLGTGRALPPNLVVPASTSRVVNTYAGVTAPLSAGDLAIPVSTIAGFLPSDLVMVLQTTGIVPEPSSGQPGPFNVGTDPVGRWELARLDSVNAGTFQLLLTAPLIYFYAMNVAQVIRVPEYQSVVIGTGASVMPAPWDGSTGGVVAFLVQGNINNNGQINANGAGPSSAGFRAGQAIRDARPRDAGICSALDELPVDGGQKGEGIASTRYPTGSGRGNVANGAGGGDCFNAGGGGGGNGGSGGNGGFSWIGDGSRNVGGLGGGALSFSALTRLALGGGGGAGHSTGGPGSNGGRGGGIVFIRASRMIGSGMVAANGQSASSGGIDDGAGGGGAGGTIYLRFSDGGVVCNSVTANGGDGGSSAAGGRGPGGGGGGGHVLIQGADLSGCMASALSGKAGSQADGGAYGADAGLLGAVETRPGPFRPTLSQPTIVTPADGSSTSNPRPPISGSGADANVTVILLLDGSELVRISSDPTGDFSFTPATDISLGTHQIQAAAEFEAVQSPPSLPNSFTIIVADGGAGDAGNLDGGPGDAGPSDAGPDAGNPDAGNIDGGRGLDFIGGGCNCQSVGGGVLVPVLLISAMVVIRRRKRRPSQ